MCNYKLWWVQDRKDIQCLLRDNLIGHTMRTRVWGRLSKEVTSVLRSGRGGGWSRCACVQQLVQWSYGRREWGVITYASNYYTHYFRTLASENPTPVNLAARESRSLVGWRVLEVRAMLGVYASGGEGRRRRQSQLLHSSHASSAFGNTSVTHIAGWNESDLV